MIRPSNSKKEMGKETAEMKKIQKEMPILFRSFEWDKEVINRWNTEARKYNILAEKVGMSKGFWQVVLDEKGIVITK